MPKSKIITIDLNDFENKTWIRSIRKDPNSLLPKKPTK